MTQLTSAKAFAITPTGQGSAEPETWNVGMLAVTIQSISNGEVLMEISVMGTYLVAVVYNDQCSALRGAFDHIDQLGKGMKV